MLTAFRDLGYADAVIKRIHGNRQVLRGKSGICEADTIRHDTDFWFTKLQARPRPSLQLGEPEIRIVPDRVRLADAGLSTQDLAVTVDAFNDGVRVAEVTEGGQQIDLMLMGPEDGIGETQGLSLIHI